MAEDPQPHSWPAFTSHKTLCMKYQKAKVIIHNTLVIDKIYAKKAISTVDISLLTDSVLDAKPRRKTFEH